MSCGSTGDKILNLDTIFTTIHPPLETYQENAIRNLIKNWNPAGKVILEVGTDWNYSVSTCLLALGAKNVVAVNPSIPVDMNPHDCRIVTYRKPFEECNIISTPVDAIFGIAILEHLDYPLNFAEKCKQLLPEDGYLYLNGGPVWTCDVGHHIYVWPEGELPGHFFHIDETNPYQPWEHLTYKTKEDARIALNKKNLLSNDIERIIIQLFESHNMSRKTPTEIIYSFKQVFNNRIECLRQYTNAKKNIYFKKAKSIYSEDDLYTYSLEIKTKR